MQALLNASFRCPLSHLVVFVGQSLHLVHRWIFWTVERGHQHLRQADIFGPRDAHFLICAEFFHGEVRADAGDSGIAKNLSKLTSLVLSEASKTRIGVTN